MTFTSSPSTPSIRYSSATIQRAERAMRCSPFLIALFTAMRCQSVDLRAIANRNGLNQGYTRRPLSELVAESELVWLIQVGLLRREVDGQGLTDSFRLTPLGYRLVEKWHHQPLPTASLSDRWRNGLNRWARLPDWIQF